MFVFMAFQILVNGIIAWLWFGQARINELNKERIDAILDILGRGRK